MKEKNVLGVFASSQKFFGISGITIVCYKSYKLVNTNGYTSLNIFELPNCYNTPILFPVIAMRAILIDRLKYGNIEYFYKQNKIIYMYLRKEILKLKTIKISNYKDYSIHTIKLKFSSDLSTKVAEDFFRKNKLFLLKGNENFSLRFSLLSLRTIKQAQKILKKIKKIDRIIWKKY